VYEEKAYAHSIRLHSEIEVIVFLAKDAIIQVENTVPYLRLVLFDLFQ
jgi:hypothetical protein